MYLYEKIVNGEEKISLVGLGYVGMPIAGVHQGFRLLGIPDIDRLFKRCDNSI